MNPYATIEHFDKLWEAEGFDTNAVEPEKHYYEFFSKLSKELLIRYNSKEEAIQNLVSPLKDAESSFQSQILKESQKLIQIKKLINDTSINFGHASESAVRIGDRLDAIEKERKRIIRAKELIKIIRALEKRDPVELQDEIKNLKDIKAVRKCLPRSLQNKSLCEFSQTLLDLRLAIIDINSTGVPNTQSNVLFISQKVESILLDEFEYYVKQYMRALSLNNDDQYLLSHAKEHATSLQFFTNGAMAEKRFLFSVVVEEMLRLTRGDHSGGRGTGRFHEGGEVGTDQLSALFGRISTLCGQQFELVHKVFPHSCRERTMRLMVQRVFNDPAFGIQALIEQCLSPAPPAPPLALAEYLSTLANVRQKLAAFHIMLEELCSKYVFGEEPMKGSQTVAARRATMVKGLSHRGQVKTDTQTSKSTRSAAPRDGSGVGANFLRDQVHQVFGGFLGDYFNKELIQLKFNYSRCLSDALARVHLHSKHATSATTVLSNLPLLKVEKFKSIASIAKSVGNHHFVDAALSCSSDAVVRMCNVARDDKKLTSKLKDTFTVHVKFLFDCVFLPISSALTSILLRHAGTGVQTSTLPPVECLSVICVGLTLIDKTKAHLTRCFASSFSDSPELLLACQETAKPAYKALLTYCREATVAWTLCVAQHVDKMLINLQTKNDFSPSLEALPVISGGRVVKGHGECTGACSHVCKALLLVVSSVQHYIAELGRLDLRQCLWRPLGQQLVAVLLGHMRRVKVSPRGAVKLLADLDEYVQVCTVLKSPETVDMVLCLRRAAEIYCEPPEHVSKFLLEKLWDLDTDVILTLVRSRADATTPAGALWAKEIMQALGAVVPVSQFPWESSRSPSLLAFKASVSPSADPLALGPVTLRKYSAQLADPDYIAHLSRTCLPYTAIFVETQKIIASYGQAESSDTQRDTAQRSISSAGDHLYSYSSSGDQTTSGASRSGRRKSHFIPAGPSPDSAGTGEPNRLETRLETRSRAPTPTNEEQTSRMGRSASGASVAVTSTSSATEDGGGRASQSQARVVTASDSPSQRMSTGRSLPPQQPRQGVQGDANLTAGGTRWKTVDDKAGDANVPKPLLKASLLRSVGKFFGTNT